MITALTCAVAGCGNYFDAGLTKPDVLALGWRLFENKWHCKACVGTTEPTERGQRHVAEQRSAVDHPSHYTMGGIEVIDAIEAWGLDFCLGNSVKYVARAGKKDPSKEIEDLEKAMFYLKRAIATRKATR